jgi:hypothetical protein
LCLGKLLSWLDAANPKRIARAHSRDAEPVGVGTQSVMRESQNAASVDDWDCPVVAMHRASSGSPMNRMPPLIGLSLAESPTIGSSSFQVSFLVNNCAIAIIC